MKMHVAADRLIQVKSYQNSAPTPYAFNDLTAWIGNAANVVLTTTNSMSGTSKQGWCGAIQGCDPWGVCATGGSGIVKTASNSNSMFTGLPVIPQVSGVDAITINVELNVGWFSSSAPGPAGPRYANMLLNFWYKHKTQAKALVIDFAVGYFERSGSSWVQRTDVPLGGQYSADHTTTEGGLTVYHYAYCLARANFSNTMHSITFDVKPVVNNAFSAFGQTKTDYNWVNAEIGAEIDTNNQSGTGTLKMAVQKCRVDW